MHVALLDGDGVPDLVTNNLWLDETELFAPDASLSLLTGQGGGQYTKMQDLTLPRGGDVALGAFTGSAAVDVAVTRRIGPGGPDALALHAGIGDGTVSGSPSVTRIPGTHTLSGGLAVLDVDGDLDDDLVSTAVDGSGDGFVVVFTNTAGAFAASLHATGEAWTSIRSLAVGDVTGDGIDDLALGERDGRLFLAMGDGLGGFTGLVTSPQAAAVGGGALTLADMNGDGVLDMLSSTAGDESTGGQSFVRQLTGTGSGLFGVKNLSGLSSVGSQGALAPLVGDLDDDGATDTIVLHGTSGTLSVLKNQLSAFATYGPGKPGKGGITPQLVGSGYSTPGGQMLIAITGAVGDTTGLFQVGVGQDPVSPLGAVPIVLFEFLVPILGPTGVAGAGFLPLPSTLPNDASFVGAEITMQVLIRDFDAGVTPPFAISATNGLAMMIVE